MGRYTIEAEVDAFLSILREGVQKSRGSNSKRKDLAQSEGLQPKLE